MVRRRLLSRQTREAARLLGAQVQAGRRERGWTLAELADRVGVTRQTLAKIERGDPTVGLGAAFEAAVLVGVALFHPDDERRRIEAARLTDRLAVLPQRVRGPIVVDDDF
jgi:transcriptional regulator with XRE-family HTH domain